MMPLMTRRFKLWSGPGLKESQVCHRAFSPGSSPFLVICFRDTVLAPTYAEQGGSDAHIRFEMSSFGCADGGRARADPGAANECCLRVHGRTKLQSLFVRQHHGRLRLSELQEGAGIPAGRSAPRTTGRFAPGKMPRANACRSAGRPAPRRDSTRAFSIEGARECWHPRFGIRSCTEFADRARSRRIE